MEASAEIKKINWFTFLQCVVIISCVWLVPNWMDRYNSTDSEALVVVLPGLPVPSSNRISDYPNYNFKSDKMWNSQKKSFLANDGYKLLDGEGRITNNSISLDCILTDDGSLFGRFHNSNGVKLDVNGYIDTETNQLKIKLGHDSDISFLNLSPTEDEESDGNILYQYSGTWGKKMLPAEFSFKIVQ